MPDNEKAISRSEMQLEILKAVSVSEKGIRQDMSANHKEIMNKLNGMPQIVKQHTKDLEIVKENCAISDKEHTSNYLALTTAINKLKVSAARSGSIAGIITGMLAGVGAYFASQN